MAWHVHFADELAAECVDDTSNGGLLALADEVEVEHTLHGTGLQAAVRTLLAKAYGMQVEAGSLLDKASCLGVEEGVRGRRGQRTAGSLKTTDVVVGRQALAGGACLVRHGAIDRRGGRHRGRSCAVQLRRSRRWSKERRASVTGPARCNGVDNGSDGKSG
jgi:hypothetical protein